MHWSENVLLAPTERTPWQSQRAFLCHFTENWGKAARLLSFGRALVAFLILVLIYCLLESRNPGRDQLHLQYGAAPGSFLRWLSWIFFGIQKKMINYIKIKIDVVRECVSAAETSSGIFTGVMLLNLTLFDLLSSSASVKNDQVSIFFVSRIC